MTLCVENQRLAWWSLVDAAWLHQRKGSDLRLELLSVLREKRAELSGELTAAEKRIVQLRADIGSLDGAIRIFDPTLEPDKIRPIPRRKKPTLCRASCTD